MVDSDTVNDLPKDIYMLDVSADKSRMAIIYKTTSKTDENAEEGAERYMLTLYNLSIDKNDQKLTRNKEFEEVDVSDIQRSLNPIYVFLSASGKSGYVALSFVEMETTGRLTNPSDNFSNCMIYWNGKKIKDIPFQGRAVFLENRLALVGLDTLVVYKYTEKNDFKKKYTLDTQVLRDDYEATKHQTEIIDDIPWARYIALETRNVTPIAGQDIITMSRHISNNVLVTQYGSKDGNIVRIWSIFDGTLLTSYKSQHVEHVMAISDNYRYIATYDSDNKIARIYCTKTCTKLHTIPINITTTNTNPTNINQTNTILTNTTPIKTQSNANSRILTMSYMRFFGNGRYIIISGFIPDETNPQTHRLYTFEVWCIPAQKLLFTGKTSVYWNLDNTGNYSRHNFIPFAMEFENRPVVEFDWSKQKTISSLRITKHGRQRNLPEIKAIFASLVDQKIKIVTKTLFKQDWSESIGESSKRWEKGSEGKESGYKTTILNTKILVLQKRSELNDSLDEYKNLFCCSIVTDNDHFILRFGYFTVQLWRLKELLPSVTESDRKEIGFQLEKRENQPYFYKSMEDNELVYIRAFKANSYGPGFTFKEDCNIHLDGRKPDVHQNERGSGVLQNKREPDILFMENIGHMLVQTELMYEYSKNKKDEPTDQKVIQLITFFQKKTESGEEKDTNNSLKISNRCIEIDEIFLPLSRFPASINSRSSTNFAPESVSSNFHEIESACRALHHINIKNKKPRNTPELSKKILSMMNDKIHKLILRLLDSNTDVRFFTTVSGSRTLAMLATFLLGQNILKYIITHPRIPISIFNYPKSNYVQESVLTVLIEEEKYDLFNAFFHRILIDSLQGGPEKLSAVAGALLCLQRNRVPELLLNCFKKLTYIPVRLDRHPILKSECDIIIKEDLFQHDDIPYLRTLNSYCTLEKIGKYKDTMLGRFLFKYAKLKRSQFIGLIEAVPATLYWFIFGENIIEYGKLCVVPLPEFNDYKVQLEEIVYEDDEKKYIKILNKAQNAYHLGGIREFPDQLVEVMQEKDAFENAKYQKSSCFTRMASSSNENQAFKQPGTVMEIITQYKWNTFLRTRFFGILLLHAVYYISYSTAVSFPEELYNYKPGDKVTHREHFVSVALMFVSGFILLLQEVFQFLREKRVYLTSFFNWVDIAAFTLPVANLCLLLNNSELLLDVGSITILVLWLHAILRLRVFSYFGKILETIIQILLKILPFICIMFLVVFAFTHAFMYRLRNINDQFFQEKYQGGPSDEEGNLLNGTKSTMYDTSSQNDFSNPFKAFSIVWFFIYGVFDPVNNGDVGDDTMTIILIILFSFVTILIFSNMVIALMSSTVDDVRRQGNVARLTHFSAVIGEIELLWCLPREKINRKKNPNYIYYVANASIVEKYCNELQKENNRLIEELR